MNRRLLLASIAFAAAGGALWWNRDWLPARGLLNPCLDPRLPESIAAHPAVARALEDLDLSKVWDGHVHLVGTGDGNPEDVWVNPALDSPWHPLEFIQKRLYMNASCVSDRQQADGAYVQRLQSLLEPYPGLRLLLLAFDYNYDESGRRRPDLSTFYISNGYAQAVAESHPRFEWICSVHPYREDALEALQWAADHGARAVKWLPPAMGMDPSSPRCDPFYQAMRRLHLPLLTHGGHELAAQGGGQQEFGNPLLLRQALEHGVRVIVAHCASLGSLIDLPGHAETGAASSNFQAFMGLMREPAYEDLLFGDISAITQVNRAPEALRPLLLAADIHHRLLNGSDYPLTGILPLFSRSQLRRLGLLDADTAAVVFEIQKYNPLLFDLVLKRNLSWQGHRFPRQVFETADFFQRISPPRADPAPGPRTSLTPLPGRQLR
jgi:mannonate dehydratase